METRRVDCVGGILFDEEGRMLLVRRGNEPARGSWSVPGGRVEPPAEDDMTALVREMWEETHLAVWVDELVGVVERDAPDGSVYVVRDYRCRTTALPGEATPPVVAGDDATEAGWFSHEDMQGLPLADGLLQALEDWDVWSLRSSTAE